MLEAYYATVAALVGLCIGSFLNVCISRWPEDESVVSPPSHCPRCDTPIRAYDNIPVLSYLILRGRCRNCGIRISPIYPAIELGTGLIWVAAVLRFGLSWQALSTATLFTLLLGIASTDARTYIIPDEFTLGGLIIGLALAFAPDGIPPAMSFAGAGLGFALLYITAVVGEWWKKQPAMGGGDIKMMAMVGAFLGPLGAVLTIFLGALVGTVVFLPITLKTGKLVPFGIFLAIGAVVTHLWGDALLGWYSSVMLGG